MPKTCIYCHKPPHEAGQLRNYQPQTRAHKKRVCIRCRYLHGLAPLPLTRLPAVNRTLARLNQPQLTVAELTAANNTPTRKPLRTQSELMRRIERRLAGPRKRYYPTKNDAEDWINLQCKEMQRYYTVVHFQDKGYVIV